VFGLALFQVLLVAATALPVWKKLRTGDWASDPPGDSEGGVIAGSDATEGRNTSND
jgi:hypothetical protein